MALFLMLINSVATITEEAIQTETEGSNKEPQIKRKVKRKLFNKRGKTQKEN
jgi:hypothetical protein